jgi:hypothetical protein
MCLAQTSRTLGHLLTSILAASERMCWHTRVLVVRHESKQKWRAGTSRAQFEETIFVVAGLRF